MDEYVKMCSQASEIQDQWQPRKADTFYLEDNTGNIHTDFIEETIKIEDYIDTEKVVWIPRQEDYQEIISNYHIWERKFEDWTPWVMIQRLYEYMDKPQIKWNSNIDLNRIYLELTMETVYNKKWDSKAGKWISVR